MRSIQQRATEIANALPEELRGTHAYVDVLRAAEGHLRDLVEQPYVPDLDLVDFEVLAQQILLRSDVAVIVAHQFPKDDTGAVTVTSLRSGGSYANYWRGHPATALGLCDYVKERILARMCSGDRARETEPS